MRGAVKLIKPPPDPRWAFEPRPDEPILDLCDLHRFGARMVHGLATSSTPNSLKYSLAADGCQYQLPIPLLENHGRRKGYWHGDPQEARIGEVVWLARTARGIFVRALLDVGPGPDLAWSLIQAGKIRAFSAAADPHKPMRQKSIAGGIKFYDAWHLREISICASGANPDTTCSIFVPSISTERRP
jgi:hypothetical protein